MGQLQMASLSLYPQFETNLMSNRNVIGLLLQLKNAKAHGRNYIKVKAHLLRNRLYKGYGSNVGKPKLQVMLHDLTEVCDN